MSVFVLLCVAPPPASLPNSISTPTLVARLWKTSHIVAMEGSKQTGSEIPDSTPHKMSLHQSKNLYDQKDIKIWINQLISLQCKAHQFHCQLTVRINRPPLVLYQSVTLDVTSEDRRIGISLRETNLLRV